MLRPRDSFVPRRRGWTSRGRRLSFASTTSPGYSDLSVAHRILWCPLPNLHILPVIRDDGDEGADRLVDELEVGRFVAHARRDVPLHRGDRNMPAIWDGC